MRVLFVDDSPVARAATGKLIGERGIDVTVCGSLAEAEEVDPRSIGAALLDLEIGEASGADLAGSLRTKAPSLPIAFLTATLQGELYERAKSYGPVFDKLAGIDQAIRWLMSL